MTTEVAKGAREIANTVLAAAEVNEDVHTGHEPLRCKEIISFTQSVETSHDGAGAWGLLNSGDLFP